MKSQIPWRRQWAMMWAMKGRPATLSRGLGVRFASAPSRVAMPPAKMTACCGIGSARVMGALLTMGRPLPNGGPLARPDGASRTRTWGADTLTIRRVKHNCAARTVDLGADLDQTL